MSSTEKLASFVCETNFDNLPSEAISRAKSSVLDGIGVAFAAYKENGPNILKEVVKDLGGNSVSTVIGAGFKTTPLLAGLVNGSMCHAIDFDDTNFVLRGHPTAVLLPTILAVGEKNNASGRDLITAYILGYEAACKIARGVGSSHYEKGYHNTSTIGIFGAATAAAKLDKLSQLELINAYGIAGSKSSGLRANFGTMTKPLHAGFAAHDGIMAALLAQYGCAASTKIFETPLGFGDVLGSNTDFNLSFKKLGDPLEIISSGSSIKQYPSCTHTHAAVDALLELMREHEILPDKIASVRCGTTDSSLKVLIHPKPKNGFEAKFSLPYCIARACLTGVSELITAKSRGALFSKGLGCYRV